MVVNALLYPVFFNSFKICSAVNCFFYNILRIFVLVGSSMALASIPEVVTILFTLIGFSINVDIVVLNNHLS